MAMSKYVFVYILLIQLNSFAEHHTKFRERFKGKNCCFVIFLEKCLWWRLFHWESMLSWRCYRKYGSDKKFIWRNKTDSRQEIIRKRDQGQLVRDLILVWRLAKHFGKCVFSLTLPFLLVPVLVTTERQYYAISYNTAKFDKGYLYLIILLFSNLLYILVLIKTNSWGRPCPVVTCFIIFTSFSFHSIKHRKRKCNNLNLKLVWAGIQILNPFGPQFKTTNQSKTFI